MNLNNLDLNLDRYDIPKDTNVQVAVFLIAADLNARKLTNTLTSIGCDACFCIPELFPLALAFAGYEQYPDTLTDYYFGLLDQFCDVVSHENNMPAREAFIIYQKLVEQKDAISNAMKKHAPPVQRQRRQTVRGADKPASAYNARLKEAFMLFMQIHPAGTLSKNLRNMLIEYLMTPSGTESDDLYETLAGLEALFMLLDAIENDKDDDDDDDDEEEEDDDDQSVSVED